MSDWVAISASVAADLGTGGFTVFGQRTSNGLPQAKMTAATRCRGCGKPFLGGHYATADLAIPPAEGSWRHRDCSDPTWANADA
jgi:hypothetical protein